MPLDTQEILRQLEFNWMTLKGTAFSLPRNHVQLQVSHPPGHELLSRADAQVQNDAKNSIKILRDLPFDSVRFESEEADPRTPYFQG